MSLNQAEIDAAIRRLAAGEVLASSSLQCPTCAEGPRRVRFELRDGVMTIALIHEDGRVQHRGRIGPGITMVCLAPEHQFGAPARYHMIDAEPKSVDETENV